MIALATGPAALIDWGSLLTVAALSVAIGVFVVSIYSFGVVGVGQWVARARGGRGPLGLIVAVASFAIAIACVAAGLFLIVDKTWKP
ncbi:MAG: hypothetical protein J2P44_02725 [Candidatus Dormibacteraeota bacterium]|nr:hypothetical protein [Candidatus Dormibacteraeota bacterium]